VAGRPVAFMCYARFDDDHYDEQLTEFRRQLAAEVRAQTGREFSIFQDREDIAWGENWREVIGGALDAVALLLVIITPGLFRSEACRAEVARFLQREQDLGRSDLILPVYYITAREIEDPTARQLDPLAKLLASRQYLDWREMRFEPITAPSALRTIAQLASRMTTAFWQRPPAPAWPGDAGGYGRRPAGGSGPQPAAGPDPYAWLARNDSEEWIPLRQRSWRQPSQGLPRSTGSQAPPTPTPPGPPPARPLTPGAGAAPLPSGSPEPPVRGAGDEPQVKPDTGDQGAVSGGDGHARLAAPRSRGAAFWRSHRLTVLTGATLAVLLAVTGTVYALVSPGSSAAAPGHGTGSASASAAASAAAARLAATLTVPGGSTVDTIWISPDSKLIAAARTITTSDIYLWNTADPDHPVTLPAPEITVGGSRYPAIVENIAFSADDATMTAILYPQQPMSGKSYVLFQWNLATGQPAPRWHVTLTPSNISFSSDNATAVESDPGAVEVVHLPPTQGKSSLLTIPNGSELSYNTSYGLDLTGTRMLYSPAEDTYDVWDFTENKVIDTWTSTGISHLSPDGQTALVSYYGGKAETLSPVPDLLNVVTGARMTPGDSRWENQLVSSATTTADATYSTDGSVIATERSGGQIDLWSSATGKYLLTISDPTYTDDSDYAIAGPKGHEVVIFGGKATGGSHQFHKLYVWDTRLS
jgi:hypothetical protein